jgi:hypothetical protein
VRWAIGSRGGERDIEQVGPCFAVLKPVGNDAEREGLDLGFSLLDGLPVSEDTGELDNFRDPAAVRFLLGFNEKRHLAP